MAVLWFVEPCSVVNVDVRFTGACCLHYQDNFGHTDLMMEAGSASETYVNIYHITRLSKPEDDLIQFLCHCMTYIMESYAVVVCLS